jgi:hypothetical protein
MPRYRRVGVNPINAVALTTDGISLARLKAYTAPACTLALLSISQESLSHFATPTDTNIQVLQRPANRARCRMSSNQTGCAKNRRLRGDICSGPGDVAAKEEQNGQHLISIAAICEDATRLRITCSRLQNDSLPIIDFEVHYKAGELPATGPSIP